MFSFTPPLKPNESPQQYTGVVAIRDYDNPDIELVVKCIALSLPVTPVPKLHLLHQASTQYPSAAIELFHMAKKSNSDNDVAALLRHYKNRFVSLYLMNSMAGEKTLEYLMELYHTDLAVHNLQELYWGHSHFTKERWVQACRHSSIFRFLKRFTYLFGRLGDDGVCALVESLSPNISELILHQVDMGDTGLKALRKCLRSVTHFAISDARLTSNVIQDTLSMYVNPNVRVIGLTLTSIDDTVIRAMCDKFKMMTVLLLNACKNLTNDMLPILARSRVSYLELRACPNITDVTALQESKHLKTLVVNATDKYNGLTEMSNIVSQTENFTFKTI